MQVTPDRAFFLAALAAVGTALAAIAIFPATPAVPEPSSSFDGSTKSPSSRPAPRGRLVPTAPSATPESSAWMRNQSGLEWADLTEGQGTTAEARQLVTVEFTGWLESGRVLDSTFKGSEPYTFVLGGGNVLAGLDEGVLGMQTGQKRLLRIPPELHYGLGGRPPRIPPNHTLLFEVQLLKAGELRQPPAAPPTPPSWEQNPSGLEWFQLQPGEGAPAQRGQKVRVEYTGWLLDGTRFDTSFDRAEPLEFALGAGRVIRGWEEGVEGMKPGERRVLRIPPALAYGARGFPPIIGPDATLLFEVALVEVTP